MARLLCGLALLMAYVAQATLGSESGMSDELYAILSAPIQVCVPGLECPRTYQCGHDNICQPRPSGAPSLAPINGSPSASPPPTPHPLLKLQVSAMPSFSPYPNPGGRTLCSPCKTNDQCATLYCYNDKCLYDGVRKQHSLTVCFAGYKLQPGHSLTPLVVIV